MLMLSSHPLVVKRDVFIVKNICFAHFQFLDLDMRKKKNMYFVYKFIDLASYKEKKIIQCRFIFNPHPLVIFIHLSHSEQSYFSINRYFVQFQYVQIIFFI